MTRATDALSINRRAIGSDQPVYPRAIRASAGMHTREDEAVLGSRAAPGLPCRMPLSLELIEPDPGS